MTCNRYWILSTPGAEIGNYELLVISKIPSLFTSGKLDRKEATFTFI